MQQKIVDKINAEWKKRSPDLDTLIAYLDQDFVDRRIFITGLSKNGTIFVLYLPDLNVFI